MESKRREYGKRGVGSFDDYGYMYFFFGGVEVQAGREGGCLFVHVRVIIILCQPILICEQFWRIGYEPGFAFAAPIFLS
jgi:hypothetical protein